MAAVSPGRLGENGFANEPAGFYGCEPFSGKGIEKHPRRRASFCRSRKMKLKNINALITGGSQGLGKVIAEHFLRDGANVALCARSEKELLATRAELAQKFPAQKVVAKTCDVSNEKQVNELVAFALRELGSLNA